jgi:hypothetical protein
MNTSKIHHDFKGYDAYPLVESEHLIRERLLECLGGLREKNEHCLAKSRDEGREKLMSQIMTVKQRVDRISEEIKKSLSGVHYKFEHMPAGDETAAREIDDRIEEHIKRCGGIIDELSCAETDMHIIERYSLIMENLGDIEKLFHERMKIFKRMQIYG